MAQILPVEVSGQLLSICQVTVVRQRDPIRRVDVEWLGFSRRCVPSGRIADMGDADTALEIDHMAGTEDIPGKAVLFAQM